MWGAKENFKLDSGEGGGIRESKGRHKNTFYTPDDEVSSYIYQIMGLKEKIVMFRKHML